MEHVRPDVLYDVTEELGRMADEPRDSLGVNDEVEVIPPEVRCERDYGQDEPAGDVPMDVPVTPIPDVVSDPTPYSSGLDEQGCFVN